MELYQNLKNRPRIFTWHIHGSYLFYLSQGNYDIYIPTDGKCSPGYYGRGETFLFGDNVHEVPVELIKDLEFDIILFQDDENYLVDQYKILSAEQRALPKIYLEHDPPWGHPTNNIHPVEDSSVTIVHVTYFNALMWDNSTLDVKIIPHGVTQPTITATLKEQKGLTLANHLFERGRIAGADIFSRINKDIPIDLIGMGKDTKGEVLHPYLPDFMANYRFFFNPMRYTSLGLAVCEAMMLGLPIVGLATTEQAVVIENGVDGFVHTDIRQLKDSMQLLLNDLELAKQMGQNAREKAQEKFNIQRFTADWESLFAEKCGINRYQVVAKREEKYETAMILKIT